MILVVNGTWVPGTPGRGKMAVYPSHSRQFSPDHNFSLSLKKIWTLYRLPVEQVRRVISPRPEINSVIPPEVVALVPDVAEVVLGASVVAGEGVEASVGGHVGR